MAEKSGDSSMLAETALVINAALDAANFLKLGLDFWDRFKRDPTPDEVARMKAEASSTTVTEIANLPDDPQVSATTLSAPIILALTAQLENVSNQIGVALLVRGIPEFERKAQQEYLSRQLCFYLNELRRYYGGHLPASLAPSWVQHSCDIFFPPAKSP